MVKIKAVLSHVHTTYYTHDLIHNGET